MANLKDVYFKTVQFYATASYPCSYLEGKQARSQVATPSNLIREHVFAELIKKGFRRSGIFTYRSHCDACHACISVRLAVNEYSPNRSQKRAFLKHQNLIVKKVPLEFVEEHYDLYVHYQNVRHNSLGMETDGKEQYRQFVLESQVNTQLVEFREPSGKLCMVSLVDVLDDALSLVYTFYDPDEKKASYGTYNIVWQIYEAKRLNLPYVYLGYWVENSPKMAYKKNFQPLYRLDEQEWVSFSINK